MQYAEIAVNAAVNRSFTYHVSLNLRHRLRVGHLVRVNFGTAMQAGIVIALRPDTAIEQTKPIIELLDDEPVMTPEHVQLGLWLSAEYLTPPGQALWLMLPPGLTGRSTRRIRLIDPHATPDGKLAAKIIAALHDNSPMQLKELERIVHGRGLKAALNQLEDDEIIVQEAMLTTPTAKPRTVRTVQATIPRDEVRGVLGGLKNAPKQQRIFRFIAQFDYPLDVPEVYDETGANAGDLNRLEERDLIVFGQRISYRDSLADRDYVPATPLLLTDAQASAWAQIQTAIETCDGQGDGAQFLLHGVTGSGKTEVYLYAIAETIKRGRQAIFLVPEIALTPQTIRRVAERFPDQVAVVHGSLSTGERHDTWQRARRGEVPVIVGTRSALFTPLPDVGLIILDEEHDHSYKHAPPFNPPYYHARRVAAQMTRLNDAVVILGSATPDIDTRYRAESDKLHYIALPNRIMGHRRRVESQAQRSGVTSRYLPATGEAMTMDMPPVTVVDMRAELKAGNKSMFSERLQAALHTVMERREQAILFLNRRGQASYVFCRDCGYVVACPNCDLPLTYHRAETAMKCHHCGTVADVPTICPECNSDRIKFFGAGTQHIEAAVKALLPTARVIRWDADTASKPDMHEDILRQFIDHSADIMVGTQMVAKGLDLPLVTLVGVVNADPGLNMPDFRAGERVFQTLAQVAGRAGRGVLGGEVILQTYSPENPAVYYAAHHDFDGFYQHEISERRSMHYPPFRRLARILILSRHPVEAEREAQLAAKMLSARITEHRQTDAALIGPAPCFFSRIDGNYRWHVILRSSDPLPILRDIQIRQNWYLDVDPSDIL